MKLLPVSAILAMFVFHSSCTTNCSSTPECWGGFQKAQTYVTERPLLYASMSLSDHFFWNGSSAGSGRRVEFSQYQRDPNSYPGVTLIPAGTTIACKKVQYRRSFEYSALEMLGEMLDGPLEGSRFDLTDLVQVPVEREISCRGITVPYYKPNPAFIRIEESEQE